MDFLEVGGVSLLVAFVAGMLSVASPCVLPMIPAYLGYLTGASLEGTTQTQTVNVSQTVAAGVGGGGSSVGSVALPASTNDRTPSPFLHSLAFVSGFSLVFIAFGVSLGLLGFILRDNIDIILKVSGSLLIIMGLHLANVITIPFLDQERRLDVGGGQKVGYARSFAVGSAFSAGWSPCIGPTLGAILVLAVSSGTVLQAGILLLVYSIGLSIPFLAMGVAYSSVKPIYMRVKRYMGVVNYVSGALLIVIGILIFTDSLINFNSLFNIGLLPQSDL
ncbi:MAG: cytochrome c biogenesis protein CcdA [Chloroflexi bacterium]|nr:cytochrome c biogenesis protein CcdA [Chloroflexota bacterium]